METIPIARFLAQLLLRWHEEVGKDHIQNLDSENAQRYLETLAYLLNLDLNKKENIHRIAYEQIQGAFEHFYSANLAHWLWKQPVRDSHAVNLGAIAGWILDLLRASNEDTQAFALPQKWFSIPQLLSPQAVEVHRLPDRTLSQMLKAYFAELTQTESLNIGGCELMIAMNEDAANKESSTVRGNFVTVYSPASFNFQFATGEGNLVTRVLEERITIEEITLGCNSGYAKGDVQGD